MQAANEMLQGNGIMEKGTLKKRQFDREYRSRRADHRGMTLIEVIIALAIMSIVLLVTLRLVLSGTIMFAKVSENVDAQTEAQILESQLSNLIVDAERSVYAYDCAGGTPTADSSGFTASAYIKVFNAQVAYYIAWDEAQQKVYYLEKGVTDGSVELLTEAEKTDFGQWYLMGEGVVVFQPDASHVGVNQRLVTVQIRVEKGKGNYTTRQNISLRNDVLNSNDLGEIYAGSEGERGEAVTAVVITPPTQTVARGDTKQLTVLVKSGDHAALSQEVIWRVGGNSSEDTKIDPDGTLHIASDEQAAVLTVMATAKGTRIYGQASVIIPTATNILVSTSNTQPAAGTVLRFNAQVSGINMSGSASSVTWSVEPSDGGIRIDNGLLTIPGSTLVGTQITVTATSVVSPGVSGSCTVTVSASGSDSGILSTDGSYDLKRGGSMMLSVREGSQNVTWSIVDDAGLGNKVKIDEDGYLTAAQDIASAADYTIRVRATLPGGTYMTQNITINKVSLSLHYNGETVSRGGYLKIPYTVNGVASTGADISVSSNPSLSNQSGTALYCTSTDLIVYIGDNVKINSVEVTISLKDNAMVKDTITIPITTGE